MLQPEAWTFKFHTTSESVIGRFYLWLHHLNSIPPLWLVDWKDTGIPEAVELWTFLFLSQTYLHLDIRALQNYTKHYMYWFSIHVLNRCFFLSTFLDYWKYIKYLGVEQMVALQNSNNSTINMNFWKFSLVFTLSF